MTTISATSILASKHAGTGDRIDTLLLRYPRWIHAEGRTHRALRIGEDLELELRTPSVMEEPALSRNASSSRAIPVEKLIADIEADPAVPIYWGANQKGMQAGAECNEPVGIYKLSREDAWLDAMHAAVAVAHEFSRAGYHKQIVNRLLEPFSHITVVVTATEWENFFALRDHKDAEPHIRDLARAIRKARDFAPVQILKPGEWHLPFDDFYCTEDDHPGNLDKAIKLSVARCASTSYKTVEGFDMTLERALALYEKLAAGNPMHASPMEHQAQADSLRKRAGDHLHWDHPQQHRNFSGFRQFRAILEEASMIPHLTKAVS